MDKTHQAKSGSYVDAAFIVVAAIIAYSALVYTAGQRIDLENWAKGEQTT